MSIVREEHPCWVATCDRCGEGDNSEYGGSFHHHTEAEASELLRDMDWRQAKDGSWLCEDCWDEATRELPCPHGGRCTAGSRGSCCLPDGPEVSTA